MKTKITALASVLTVGLFSIEPPVAIAQNVQVNGNTAEPPTTEAPPATQVQVNTPAQPAPTPVVVNNNVSHESGGYLSRPGRRLMLSGGTLFGVTYLGTVLGAAIISDVCNADSALGCREAKWPIYIPIVGPFIQMGYISGNAANTGRAVLAIDGVLQASGLAMFIAGAALWSSSSRSQAVARRVQVAPYSTGSGSGLLAFGRF